MFARRLDGGDCALFGHGQVDQLPGAAAGFGREIKVVAQQEQERLAGDKLAGTPDRMAITLGLGLDREAEALLEIEVAAGLLFGPFHSLERRPQIGRVVAELLRPPLSRGSPPHSRNPSLHLVTGRLAYCVPSRPAIPES